LKALLARKKQSRGPKLRLEYLEGAAGPKKQFERPKPCLEYLGGAAGPKRQFEGPKPCLEYLDGAAGPKETIRDNFDQKILSKEQTSLIRRTSFETFSKRQSRRKTLRMFR
jgi:hypothetical protein